MKNIYFGLAIAAVLSFSACSSDDDDEKSSSSNNPSSSSGSGSISACLISANPSPTMKFSLCWEGKNITKSKCDAIANDYRTSGAGDGEIMDSCPKDDLTDSCSSENGTVYRYNYGTVDIPMPCQSLLVRL